MKLAELLDEVPEVAILMGGEQITRDALSARVGLPWSSGRRRSRDR